MKSLLYAQLVNDLRNIDATRVLSAGDVTNISYAAWLIDSMEYRIAELERFKAAYEEWHEKTEWVQETATSKELGKHRADVLRERIAELEKDAARWRAATRDMKINDIAVYCFDKYGDGSIVMGDKADAAIDAAMQGD